MNTPEDLDQRSIDLVAALQRQAADLFDRELSSVRSAVALCEQSLDRFSENQWVPLDAVSRLAEELKTAAGRERTRADNLAAELEAARHDVQAAHAQFQVAINAAKEAAAREREEAAAAFARELNAARELARSIAAKESQVRQDLEAVRVRSQEIVDAQMLQLIEFKRELEQASATAERARGEAEAAKKEAASRPAAAPTSITKVMPQIAQNRNQRAPEFAAIEAVLAGSPPVGVWRRAGG
jgi:hypothetical protein